QPESSKGRGFYEYGPLKEAYLKARGLGLALPLEGVSFEVGAGRIAARFAPEIGDDPLGWRFALLPLAPAYVAAVAVRAPGDETQLALEGWRILPLTAERSLQASVTLLA